MDPYAETFLVATTVAFWMILGLWTVCSKSPRWQRFGLFIGLWTVWAAFWVLKYFNLF